MLLFKAKDRIHRTPGEFTYRRCTSCATVFQDPRVIYEDLELCYPEEYYTQGQEHEGTEVPRFVTSRRLVSILRDRLRAAIACSVQGEPLREITGSIAKVLATSARLRERAFFGTTDELIPRTKRRVRALDVGCGAGLLMKQLQLIGWEIEGVEWSPVGAERARRNTGRPVLTGDFREAELPLASYDLILLSHVFEHLQDPIGALRRVKELLAPDGRAVLFYPNPQSLGARILGKSWFCWEVPRHLVLPPAAALSEAAQKGGLILSHARTTARFAAEFFCKSRVLPIGSAPDVRPNIWDKALGLLESLLIVLGLDVGDEVIAVFRKVATE